MTAPTPNATLAYRVLDHIDAHPESWNQLDWITRPDGADCGTAACFAGWTALLSGDQPRWARDWSVRTDYVLDPDGERRDISVRASELLGINDEQADDLFCAVNTRPRLGTLVAEIFGPRPDGGEGGNVTVGGAS